MWSSIAVGAAAVVLILIVLPGLLRSLRDGSGAGPDFWDEEC